MNRHAQSGVTNPAGHGVPRNGTAPDKWEAQNAADDTSVVLFRMGALARDRHGTGPDRPTADGALFARTALRTWPPAKGLSPERSGVKKARPVIG
jgi:hypothetical protein